jgi:hypothetical protein
MDAASQSEGDHEEDRADAIDDERGRVRRDVGHGARAGGRWVFVSNEGYCRVTA